jgi:hypothetical protein
MSREQSGASLVAGKLVPRNNLTQPADQVSSYLIAVGLIEQFMAGIRIELMRQVHDKLAIITIRQSLRPLNW